MIPEWAERFLGEEGEAEFDPRSGEAIAWGRRLEEEIPEDLFDALKGKCEMRCVFPDWFVVLKRRDFAELLMANGGVRAVGVGPGGGFKWVRFANDSVWGHTSFRSGALRELEKSPRLKVACDKDGKEKGAGGHRTEKRIIGRPKSGRRSSGRRKGR